MRKDAKTKMAGLPPFKVYQFTINRILKQYTMIEFIADKPHNPMVNAGAIVIGSLLKQELPLPDRFDFVSLNYSILTDHEGKC